MRKLYGGQLGIGNQAGYVRKEPGIWGPAPKVAKVGFGQGVAWTGTETGGGVSAQRHGRPRSGFLKSETVADVGKRLGGKLAVS